MPESQKATRATVILGSLEIDGFMLPDGSSRMSLSQTGELVEKQAQGVSNFLRSKFLKRLLGEDGGISNFLPAESTQALTTEGYTPDQFAVNIGDEGSQGQTRIRGLPLEVVSLYWIWECYRGNRKAFVFVVALATESLRRRFDKAFGIERSEQEYDEIVDRRIQQLTQQLDKLGEAYAIEDTIRQERDLFLKQLRELGSRSVGVAGWGVRMRSQPKPKATWKEDIVRSQEQCCHGL